MKHKGHCYLTKQDTAYIHTDIEISEHSCIPGLKTYPFNSLAFTALSINICAYLLQPKMPEK